MRIAVQKFVEGSRNLRQTTWFVEGFAFDKPLSSKFVEKKFVEGSLTIIVSSLTSSLKSHSSTLKIQGKLTFNSFGVTTGWAHQPDLPAGAQGCGRHSGVQNLRCTSNEAPAATHPSRCRTLPPEARGSWYALAAERARRAHPAGGSLRESRSRRRPESSGVLPGCRAQHVPPRRPATADLAGAYSQLRLGVLVCVFVCLFVCLRRSNQQ